MTKWKNLAGKFTDREIEVIEKFQKKHGLENSNQMVRISILFMIGFTEVMSAFVNSKFAKTLRSNYGKLQNEVSKFPSLKEQIQPFFKEMDQNLTKTMENIAERKARDLSSFGEKRKLGRPKAAKKPPGRPKDKGF